MVKERAEAIFDRAAMGGGQDQTLLRAGHAHVEQTAFFRQVGGRQPGQTYGQKPIFASLACFAAVLLAGLLGCGRHALMAAPGHDASLPLFDTVVTPGHDASVPGYDVIAADAGNAQWISPDRHRQ
jgi:hypothetical protein